MPRYECQACHGTFQSPLDDGLEYYHVCPPLSMGEIIAHVNDRTLEFDPKVQELAITAQTPDSADVTSLQAREAARAHLANVVILRPGHVNQNIVMPDHPLEKHERADIRSAGAGVKKLEAQP